MFEGDRMKSWNELIGRALYHQMPPPLQVKEDILRNLEHVAILAPHMRTYPQECTQLFSTKDTFFDNMILEGSPLPVDDYINMVNRYKPALFVLPDVINDADATYEQHIYACAKLDSLKGAMAVIQGIPSRSFVGWCKEIGIETFGVPYLEGYNRYAIITSPLLTGFKIHLLGIEHVSELYLYSSLPSVISADTTLAYTTAAAGHLLSEYRWSKFKISDSKEEKVEVKEEGLNVRIAKNIIFIKALNW
jgi:hypothetical protein